MKDRSPEQTKQWLEARDIRTSALAALDQYEYDRDFHSKTRFQDNQNWQAEQQPGRTTPAAPHNLNATTAWTRILYTIARSNWTAKKHQICEYVHSLFSTFIATKITGTVM